MNSAKDNPSVDVQEQSAPYLDAFGRDPITGTVVSDERIPEGADVKSMT